MKIVKKLKKAIGMAEAQDAAVGLNPYQRHLTNAAKKKLKNRGGDQLKKKSRKRNRGKR